MFPKLHVFLVLIPCIVSYKVEVKVKQGKIFGGTEVTVFDKRLYFTFYRVPYAQPPIGKLRFKNPKPYKKWSRIRDARKEFHGACAQAHIVYTHRQFGVEDCLYLNIYTPSIPKTDDNYNLKPVIVWLHGYAFYSSFSHIHGGDFFIDNDLVLVTATHRIGVFGFLKLHDTDSNANMGLKDIVMALKWIRTNIKHFGGDKDNIILMGSNSAATFITLLLMTEANKLFSKIILQSGAIFSASIFQGDSKLERNRLIKELDNKRLKISKASTKDIIDASQKIYSKLEVQNFQRPLVPFSPIVESKTKSSLLMRTPQEFHEILKRKHINKPILIGFNTQESISEVMPFIQNPYHLRSFSKDFKFIVPFSDGCRYNISSNDYKLVSNKIKNRYFRGEITEKSLENLLKYTSDLILYPIIKFIKTYLKISSSNMFMYKFDYRGTLNAVKATSLGESKVKVKGVATGDEICYLLKCEPLWEYYVKMNRDEVNTDKEIIKDMTALWSNFAKYGDPTPAKYDINITWPPMSLEGSNVLLIQKSFKTIDFRAENSILGFWDYIYEIFYKEERCNNKHDEL